MQNVKWIEHPTVLLGRIVQLRPLEKEDLQKLFAAACDRDIWEYLPIDGSDWTRFEGAYLKTLAEREERREYPFIIIDNASSEIIGSTRLTEIIPQDRKLEIGWTWIKKDFWGSRVNMECKFLLLSFCFEQLKVVRVQLRARDSNFRSRKAIEKIGAQFEGVLRNFRILANGQPGNAAYYSIIDEEWPAAKQKILGQLQY